MRKFILFISLYSSSLQAETLLPFSMMKSMFGSGEMTLACDINSTPLDKCKIDTGAPFSSVGADKLTRLGEVINRVDVMAFGGKSVNCDVTIGNQITLDNRMFDNSLLLMCPELRARRVDAILGLDLLSTEAFSIDFEAQILRLNDQSRYDGLNKLTQDSSGHILLPMKVGKEGLLNSAGMFDTGAGLSIVDLAFVERHPDLFTVLSENSVVDTHGNKIVTKTVLAHHVKIGELAFTVEYFMAVDLSAAKVEMGENVDFIIGYNVLKTANWYFNLQDLTWKNWR